MYLVDSSVILKWFLLDEVDSKKAHKLYMSMRSGEAQFATDSSVIHEVANVLHSKANKSALEIVDIVNVMFRGGMSLISDEQRSLVEAIRIGFTRKIGTHDAVLITAAIKSTSTLITADHLLFKVAKDYTTACLLQEMRI